jgi:hypothetical protein
MKPWRPFWKNLDLVMDQLLRDAGTAPFKVVDLDVWIAGLRFSELSICDDESDRVRDQLLEGNLQNYHPIFDQTIHWQLLTRCECALDFCRGRVEKRSEYDWNQDEKIIYHWLLVDFWRNTALHWACRTGKSRSARIGFMHPFWKYLKNPQQN